MMRARFVNEQRDKSTIYNKKQLIDLMLANQGEDCESFMRKEYETADPEEFEELAASIGFHPIGKYWTAENVVNPYDSEDTGLVNKYGGKLRIGDKVDLDQDFYDRNSDYDVDESVNENGFTEEYLDEEFGIYHEITNKLEEFLPDNDTIVREFRNIITNNDISKRKKIEQVVSFLHKYADMDTLEYYMPKEGNIKGFAKHLIYHV